MVEKSFDLGETTIIKCQIKDAETEEPVDPDKVKITIEINLTKKVDNKDMIPDSKGNYHYDYTSDEVGRHEITIKAEQTAANRITIQKTTFLVF